QAPDDQAGKVLACAHCRQPLRVPRTMAGSPAPPPPPASGLHARPSAEAPAPASTSEQAVWFILRGGAKKGPATWSQLRHLAATGQLQADDLVWAHPMASAVPGGSMPGLFPEVPAPVSVRAPQNELYRPEYPYYPPSTGAEPPLPSIVAPPLWKR